MDKKKFMKKEEAEKVIPKKKGKKQPSDKEMRTKRYGKEE